MSDDEKYDRGRFVEELDKAHNRIAALEAAQADLQKVTRQIVLAQVAEWHETAGVAAAQDTGHTAAGTLASQVHARAAGHFRSLIDGV
jgi:hypothetical protein